MLLEMFKSFFLLMILMRLIIFMKFKNYILIILISLEFIVINIYILIYLFIIDYIIDWFLIYFIIIGVCEGVIGLSMVVKMINFFGNQNINNLNLVWY